MNILECSWLVFDTETTGPDPETDRVVELGAVRWEGGVQRWSHGRLVNPGVPIPAEASAVHGITDADVASAPPLAEVAPRFVDQVERADVLVGYNALHFDIPILARELGEDWARAAAVQPRIDPLVLVRLDHVGRYWRGSGRHRLTAVAERFGIEAGTAHRAAGDCETTARLLWYLLQHLDLPTDAYELSDLCWKQGQLQRAELDAYFANRGRR